MSNQPPAKATPKRDRLHPKSLLSSLTRHRSRSPSTPTSSSIINNQTPPANLPSLSTTSASNVPTTLATGQITPSPTVSSAPQSISISVSTIPSGIDILTSSLLKLSDSERNSLQPWIGSANRDVNQAIEECLIAAKQKRKELDAARWSLTFAGHTFIPKEAINKIVRWLDRCKTIGDIAVNADPIHAGLPWAAIRLLLEIATSDHKQMAGLLAGCETTLYMVNRLRVYLDFLSRLPTSLSQSNFTSALIDMYSQILAFLAKAIDIYQQSALRRVVTAFWHETDITAFEQTCDRLAVRLEIEASNCDRTVAEEDRQGLQSLHQDMSTMLGQIQQIRSVQATLQRLERKIDRSHLRIVESAMFNAYNQTHRSCHSATRVDLLQSIYTWAQHSTSKSIFWLNGAAGTGKSTISWTVAKHLVDESFHGVIDMGGSFFFKRGEGDRGHAQFLFPTIAYQLALKLDELDDLVAEAVNTDPSICSKSLGEQFDKLIRQPLRNLTANPYLPTYIIVIDALDECDSRDIPTVLQLWSELTQFTNIRLRLFLTSRPNLSVLDGFDELSVTAHLDVDLHEANRSTTRDDLTLFLRDSFVEMRNKYNRRPLLGIPLDSQWPEGPIIDELVDMADPLFIVAKTVCLFVGDPHWDPTERLTSILQSRKTGQMSQMAQTYLPVLQHLTVSSGDPSDNERICSEFRLIVGTIISLTEPLSISALAALLNISVPTVVRRLEPLRSVLEIPVDMNTPVRPLHLSFAEFLTSQELRSRPFGIDSSSAHGTLLTSCLKILSSPSPVGLHENKCDLREPGQLQQETASEMIEKRSSPAIRYACQHWSHHALMCGIRIDDMSEIYAFLREHFLHWLEALSLLGQLADVIGYIADLQPRVSPTNSRKMSDFLEDARRFVLTFRAIGELAPLQLYSSATIFSPEGSVIKKLCRNIPAWIVQSPTTSAKWSQELQKLEGHELVVGRVAFSPDGLLLASTSLNQDVRVWSAATGQELYEFLYGSPALDIDRLPRWLSFSTDGLLLAVVAGKNTDNVDRQILKAWNVSTGQEVQNTSILSGRPMAAVFTPLGIIVAYAPDIGILLVENTTTDQELHRFVVQEAATLENGDKFLRDGMITDMVFSPDYSLLASSFHPDTIRVWRMDSGEEVLKLSVTPSEMAEKLTISTDNQLLPTTTHTTTSALNSVVCAIHIWAIDSGHQIQALEVHDRVIRLKFSPDSSSLCLISLDGNGSIVSIRSGQGSQRFQDHTGMVTDIAFSPIHTLIALACGDRTVRLRTTDFDKQVLQRAAHESSGIKKLAFSSDGSLLASVSSNQLIQIRCASTGSVLRETIGDCSFPFWVGFSSNSSLLALQSGGNAMYLWDYNNEEKLLTLSPGIPENSYDWGNRSTVVSKAFSLNGKFLVFHEDSPDGSVLWVWCLPTRKQIQTVSSTKPIFNVEFGKDSTSLLTDYGRIPIVTTNENIETDLEDIVIEDEYSTSEANNLTIKGSWIKHCDQKLLWLPKEYRDAEVALYKSMFAFGLPNGRVEYLRIGPPYA